MSRQITHTGRSCRWCVMLLAAMCVTISSTSVLGQTYVCGHITDNTTWDLAGSPYILTCTYVWVDSGVTLTIEPGVEVQNGGQEINVKGVLEASGASFVDTVPTNTIAVASGLPSPPSIPKINSAARPRATITAMPTSATIRPFRPPRPPPAKATTVVLAS